MVAPAQPIEMRVRYIGPDAEPATAVGTVVDVTDPLNPENWALVRFDGIPGEIVECEWRDLEEVK